MCVCACVKTCNKRVVQMRRHCGNESRPCGPSKTCIRDAEALLRSRVCENIEQTVCFSVDNLAARNVGSWDHWFCRSKQKKGHLDFCVFRPLIGVPLWSWMVRMAGIHYHNARASEPPVCYMLSHTRDLSKASESRMAVLDGPHGRDSLPQCPRI